jgi:ABC-type amino acid transport substrate-binding protein
VKALLGGDMFGRKLGSILASAVVMGTLIAGCSSDSPGSSTSQAPTDRLAEIQERGTLLVGIGVYPPLSYFDEEQNWKGYDADIWRAICEKLTVECVPVFVPLVGIGPALENGTIDSYLSLYKTPEREEIAAYGQIVYYNSIGLAARTDSGINALPDVEGKTLGAVRASGEETALQALAKDYPCDIKVYETGDVMLQDMIAGRLDGVIWPEDLVTYAVQTDAKFKDVKVVTSVPPEYFGGDPSGQALYYVAPKGEDGATLMQALDDAVIELQESGDEGRILADYGFDPETKISGSA